MFIRPAFFRYLVRNAGRHNLLKIRNDGDNYIIDGGLWLIAVEIRTMPNYAKAALVEWAGELPAAGIQIAVQEDGNQLEMETLEIPEVKGRLYKETTLTIWNNRVLQNAARDIALAKIDFTDTISKKEIETNESDVEGPYVSQYEVTYKNNRMLLQCRRQFLPEYQQVLDVLRGVNLGPVFSETE